MLFIWSTSSVCAVCCHGYKQKVNAQFRQGTDRCRTASETHWNILIQSILTSHFEREREREKKKGGGRGTWREREKFGALILYWILGLPISVHGLNDEHNYGNRIENWMEQSFHYYMNACQVPHLEVSPKHFTKMANITLFSATKQTHSHSSHLWLWTSDCSFRQLIFEYQPEWRQCWCHMKLLLFQRTICVHHTTMHQFTGSLYSEPHTLDAYMFSCNLPSALWADWPGYFMCYCGNTRVEENSPAASVRTLTHSLSLWVGHFTIELSLLSKNRRNVKWLLSLFCWHSNAQFPVTLCV